MENREFEDVFSGYEDRLKRLISVRMDQRLRNRVDVSDVLQETLIEAHRRKDEYRSELMPPYLWLRMIAGQKLVDIHRQHISTKKRSILREDRFPEASSIAVAAELVGNLTSVSEAVMRAELKMRIEGVLEQMEEIDREIIALRHFENLTNAEIAKVLNISPTAASNRYIRALQRLRGVLPDNL